MLLHTAYRPHPLHALLLGFPIALFTFALFTDIAFLRTAQIQWSNFSAWLITGALVFGGIVGLFALVELALAWRRGAGRPMLVYVVLLALAWVLGLVNAFKHSQDGWSSVGALGLILSILCTLLSLAAGWMAYSAREVGR
jgi:Predicted membrane protein